MFDGKAVVNLVNMLEDLTEEDLERYYREVKGQRNDKDDEILLVKD